VGEDPNNRHRPAPILNVMTFCRAEATAYTNVGEADCGTAISAAFSHLIALGMLAPDIQQGQYGWFALTRRGQATKTTADFEHYKKLSLYPRGSIHPLIEQETYSEFLRGDYETAVFKAFKAIEVKVRDACGFPADLIGQKLMVKAFHTETGPLRDTSEVPAEREALMNLFAGAIARFKNPTSHREVNFDSIDEAVETLRFASLLMRVVERRAWLVTST
jgi:uncharacterized protein (TIGR02391 family)